MDYYNTLGIGKKATESEIKKAYKKLALKYHPDKAPADKKKEYEEKFKEIAEAYSVLTDPEKKKIYDTHGKEGLDGNAGFGTSGANVHFSGGIDPDDIFREFFGRSNPFGGSSGGYTFRFNHGGPSRRIRKGKTIRYVFNLTLEEMFKGITKKLKMPDKNNKKRIVEIEIPKSVHHGHAQILENMVYAGKDVIPSDLQIVINQKQHETFVRDRDDLHMKLAIPYSEVKKGIKRTLTMVDGTKHDLVIKKLPSSDYTHIVHGQGMHVHGTNKRGTLNIHFNITF